MSTAFEKVVDALVAAGACSEEGCTLSKAQVAAEADVCVRAVGTAFKRLVDEGVMEVVYGPPPTVPVRRIVLPSL